jgi:hypothetical protein
MSVMCARTSRPFHSTAPGGDIDAIGGRVLADDQQFLRTRRDQLFRLAQHRIDPPRDEITPNRGDDAECAGVVTAFGDFQVAVMAWRQLETSLQEQDRQMHWEQSVQLRAQPLQRLRTDAAPLIGENFREPGSDHIRFIAHAARHDDTAILCNRFANRLQTILPSPNPESHKY